MNPQSIFNNLEMIRHSLNQPEQKPSRSINKRRPSPDKVYNKLKGQAYQKMTALDYDRFVQYLDDYYQKCQQGHGPVSDELTSIYRHLLALETSKKQQQATQKQLDELRHGLTQASTPTQQSHNQTQNPSQKAEQAYQALLREFYNRSQFSEYETFYQNSDSAQILRQFYQQCQQGTIVSTTDEQLHQDLINQVPQAANIDYNRQLYATLLPYARLMHQAENNGIPEEHAFKLAAIFLKASDAFQYLRWFNKTNPDHHYPFHDACLFSLPEQKFDRQVWGQLAGRYYTEPVFWPLVANAPQLEADIKTRADNRNQAPTQQQLHKARQTIQNYRSQCKQLRKNRGQQTQTQRLDNDRQLGQLQQALADAQHGLVNLAPDFNSELVLEDLRAVNDIQVQNASPIYRLFRNNGLPDKKFHEFKSLQRQDDNDQLPSVMIRGDDIASDYQGYYLKKLQVEDDNEAALAAVLGKLTDCCQSLSGEAGEPCVRHGLTSPYGGFYVLFKANADGHSANDKVVAQAWSWRSETGALVLDSIESAHMNDNNTKGIIADLFKVLGKRLVHEGHTHKVVCGQNSGIEDPSFINTQLNPLEQFKAMDDPGYNDSKKQSVIYEKDKPYYWYHVDQNEQIKTNELLDRILENNNTPLNQSSQLLGLLVYALYHDQALIDVIHDKAQQHGQGQQMTALIRTEQYSQDRLSIDDMLTAIENNELSPNARNEKQQGLTPLLQLIDQGDPSLVDKHWDKLITQGADINANDDNGRTALMLAAQHGHLDIVNSLINADADINAKDGSDNCAINFAAQNGNVKTITALLKHGAHLDSQLVPSLLKWASEQNHPELLNILIEKGVHNKTVDSQGNTALMLAAKNGHMDIVNSLINAGAEVNAPNNLSDSPLSLAIWHHQPYVANRLLQAGAQLTADYFLGPELLRQAGWQGHLELVDRLIEAGVPAYFQDRKGNSALTLAFQQGHYDIVIRLLEAGAFSYSNTTGAADTQRNEGRSLLNKACEQGNFDLYQRLIEAGVQSDKEKDTTLLKKAAEQGRLDIVNTVIDSGVQVTGTYLRGSSPLIQAVEQGHLDIVNRLINAGAQVKVKDDQGRTALILAFHKGHLDIANRLIDSGADVNDKDRRRKTVLMQAVEQGRLETVNKLIKAGASINHRDSNRYTALMLAAEQGHLEITNRLVEAGASMDQKARGGRSALTIAIEQGHSEIVVTLIRNGADIHTNDDFGRSPMAIAAKRDHLEIMNTLLSAITYAEYASKYNMHNSFNAEQAKLSLANLQKRHDYIEQTLQAVNSKYSASLIKYIGVMRSMRNIAQRKIMDNQLQTAYQLINYQYQALDEGIHEMSVGSQKQANPDEVVTHQLTDLLTSAADRGFLDVVDLLIQAGANVNDKNQFRDSKPLSHAAKRGHLDLVNRLAQAGARIDLWAQPLLMQAAEHGHLELINHLIGNSSTQVNKIDRRGRSILMQAARSGHLEVVNRLLAAGASVHAKDRDGRSALLEAVEFGDPVIVDTLIKAGAQVDQEGPELICRAASQGHLQVVDRLIREGAQVNDNSAFKKQSSALKQAARKGYFDVVNRLIEAKAHIDQESLLCLEEAAKKGHLEVVNKFIEQGCPVDTRNALGSTPLMAAALCGHKDVVKRMIQAGAQVDCQDRFGRSAMTMAAEKGHLEILNVVANAQAEAEVQSLYSDQDSAESNGIKRKFAKLAKQLEFLDTSIRFNPLYNKPITEYIERLRSINPVIQKAINDHELYIAHHLVDYQAQALDETFSQMTKADDHYTDIDNVIDIQFNAFRKQVKKTCDQIPNVTDINQNSRAFFNNEKSSLKSQLQKWLYRHAHQSQQTADFRPGSS